MGCEERRDCGTFQEQVPIYARPPGPGSSVRTGKVKVNTQDLNNVKFQIHFVWYTNLPYTVNSCSEIARATIAIDLSSSFSTSGPEPPFNGS
jgi:hypothetical protein